MRASVACDGQVSDNPKHKLTHAAGSFAASPLLHLRRAAKQWLGPCKVVTSKVLCSRQPLAALLGEA